MSSSEVGGTGTGGSSLGLTCGCLVDCRFMRYWSRWSFAVARE